MNDESTKIRILMVSSTSQEIRRLRNILFHDMNECEVVTSINSRHAFDLINDYKAQGKPFDAVFLDYHINGCNGIELATQLIYLYPGVVYAFFFSAVLRDPVIREAYTNLFGYYKEPIFNFDHIMNIIETIMANRQRNYAKK